MKRQSVLVLVVVLLSVANIASADMVQGINMDFVTIGNAGNPGDTRTVFPNSANPYGAGAVGYEYKIGKYEVSNAQWDVFTSAAGAPTGNPSDAYDRSAIWTGDNIPTNSLSWYEAAQFCNYLTSGDKSLGAYLFSGDNTNPGYFLGIDRDSAVSTFGIAYVIPTADEWYKAAYYTGSGYSTYANGLDTIPAADNGWNYRNGSYSTPWDIGMGTEEQNGTFNMMGNVWEWTETKKYNTSSLIVRGGSYNDDYAIQLSSQSWTFNGPSGEPIDTGFRVASVPAEVVPVPSAVILGSIGLTFSGWLLKRKRMV